MSGVLLVWVDDATGFRCPACGLFVCIPKREGATCPRCRNDDRPAASSADDKAGE